MTTNDTGRCAGKKLLKADVGPGRVALVLAAVMGSAALTAWDNATATLLFGLALAVLGLVDVLRSENPGEWLGLLLYGIGVGQMVGVAVDADVGWVTTSTVVVAGLAVVLGLAMWAVSSQQGWRVVLIALWGILSIGIAGLAVYGLAHEKPAKRTAIAAMRTPGSR